LTRPKWVTRTRKWFSLLCHSPKLEQNEEGEGEQVAKIDDIYKCQNEIQFKLEKSGF